MLIEHDGASTTVVTNEGGSAWNLLLRRLGNPFQWAHIAQEVSALLRAMLVRGNPPPGYANRLLSAGSTELAQTVREGVRLRARLPGYLVQRRALVDTNCPLLPPLWALVHGYEEPTTTDELWATGLGHHYNAPSAPDPRAAIPPSAALRACVRSASDHLPAQYQPAIASLLVYASHPLLASTLFS